MGVVITGEYLGKKRSRMHHEPSGATLIIDAPKDNQGEGSSFSPTDLLAASLGGCVMTVMGIVADRDGIDLTGMRMRMEKHMSSTPPRRVAHLPVEIHLPAHLSPDDRVKLERTARACPVHHSLNREIVVDLQFLYDVL